MSIEDKVSENSKQLVLGGLGVVAFLAGLYVFVPESGTREFLLPIATGVLGFLAGIAQSLWGK